jgi:hypothetical protein
MQDRVPSTPARGGKALAGGAATSYGLASIGQSGAVGVASGLSGMARAAVRPADADRIGVIGVCGGGGGYVLNATLTEKRIKAVVAITPVNIGRLFREDFSNYDPLGALDAMAAHRT